MYGFAAATSCILLYITRTSSAYMVEKNSSERFVFLFSKTLGDSVLKVLEENNWIKLYQITTRTYIFKYSQSNCRNYTDSIALLKRNLKNVVVEIEPVKHYIKTIRFDSTDIAEVESPLNLVCDKYYGMGIEQAWSRGYSGKGVVVAVIDVGVNTDLIDLEPNIKNDSCFNFVDNSTDVTPEYFHSYKELESTDHGNRCASLIAAVKGNDFCSAGIAFNASIAALKIFEVYLENTIHIHERTSSDMMARSQVYGLHEIDIYSNSWGLTQPFSEISLDMKDAIKTSAMKGRRNLGAVHVFPVGSPGNELANNEYTITVSAIGQNGTVSSDSVTSSSVLTSGLQDGNNLTAGSMVTTSFKNKCISKFKGTSAATAQVAGIIALALEAKPGLTLADIEDLIVRSSDVSCLKDSLKIRRNAAGLKYHPVFGFGLLNATKLVVQAEKVEEGLEFSRIALRQIQACYDGKYEYTAEFCYSCTQDVNSLILIAGCVREVKTVKVQVRYFTTAIYMRITLISPHGTESVLQDFGSSGVRTDSSGRTQILTSVHFWDEMSFGLWRFKIQSDEKTDVKGNVSLTLFGIMSDYTVNETDSRRTNCTPSCPSPTDDTVDTGVPQDTYTAIAVAVAVVGIIISFFIIRVVYRICKNRNSQRTEMWSSSLELQELSTPQRPSLPEPQEPLMQE